MRIFLRIIYAFLRIYFSFLRNKKIPIRGKKNLQRPYLPHRLQCSTSGAEGLNFQVRNVSGCVALAITTDH